MNDGFEQEDWLRQAALEEQTETAKSAALKYISVRMRTKNEVESFLHKKNYPAELIEEVIAFLLRYQYLDDAAYCRAWIHEKVVFHPCGRKKMAMELAKKVSDKQLIRDCLEEYFSEEQEQALALEAANQKLRSHAGKKQIGREQIARFLYGRGYSGTVIGHVLQELDL